VALGRLPELQHRAKYAKLEEWLMNISELVRLANWIEEYVGPSLSPYDQLATILEQNATQSAKQAVKPHLDAVERALKRIPSEQLSDLQIELLKEQEIFDLVGLPGWKRLEATLLASDYDPASVAAKVRADRSSLERVASRFKRLTQSLTELDIDDQNFCVEPARVEVRVRFTRQASIQNPADLKKWSADWYDIIRGIALCVDEKPQDTLVIGATEGSLIVIFSASVPVAKVLALLSKYVTTVVMNGLQMANAMEDLRHKKIMNRSIEEAMKAQAKQIAETGAENAFKAIVEHAGVPDGEKKGPIKIAVDKFFNFSDKGGEVDLLPPPSPPLSVANDDEADDETTDDSDDLTALNEVVEEVRKLRDEARALLEPPKQGE
jgi:hypothetical protein